jgi:hypothetical protein
MSTKNCGVSLFQDKHKLPRPHFSSVNETISILLIIARPYTNYTVYNSTYISHCASEQPCSVVIPAIHARYNLQIKSIYLFDKQEHVRIFPPDHSSKLGNRGMGVGVKKLGGQMVGSDFFQEKCDGT